MGTRKTLPRRAPQGAFPSPTPRQAAVFAFLHILAASHARGLDARHWQVGHARRCEPSLRDLPVTARAALCAGLTLRPGADRPSSASLLA